MYFNVYSKLVFLMNSERGKKTLSDMYDKSVSGKYKNCIIDSPFSNLFLKL